MKNSLGQLLIIGLEGTQWSSSCAKLLRRYQPGGMLVLDRNLRAPDLTAELFRKIAAALDVLPFLAIEQEGGSIDPLRRFFPPLPSPHIAAVKGSAMVERLGALIGEACALLGFNLNFAPRLELADPELKPSLQPQMFHSDPKKVAQCGEAFVDGLRRHKVLACAKHFPGPGSAEFVGDNPLPIVDKPMRALWRGDLLPFRQTLSKLAIIKMSYSAYKAYDFDLAVPAACSTTILNGLLRVKLGYGGAAIADHFTPAPITFPPLGQDIDFSIPVKNLMASLISGCDMHIVPSWGTGSLDLCANSVSRALEEGSLSTQRLNEALKRIHRAKRGLRRPAAKFSGRVYDQLCRKFEEFHKDIQTMEREIA